MHSTHLSRWHVRTPVSRRADRTDDGPGLLASRAFWLSGVASLGFWAALAWAVGLIG